MDRSGQVLLGKYQLTRVLGRGGMGEVWEGEHQLTGRRVAVKVLSDAYLSNKKVVARFGREARAASAVQHDGIVEILDQDRTDEGVPFLVMEFLEGESVGQRIKRKRKLNENETLAIMLPLLEALDAAHQAGVIHRDLKPDNVFILPGVRGDERIKILDFGISQKADEIDHRLTQEGSVLGTPHYMSPEQARGEANIDVRVDVYAVAVMLYECSVGEVPFDATNYNALLQTIISQPPVPPRVRGGLMSAAVEQVVLAGLAKRRDDRPPSARVLRELLLEAGLQGEAVELERSAWRFRSVPQAQASLSLLSSLSSPSSLPPPTPRFSELDLEEDPFKPARTTGSFALPRSPRHFEPAWSNSAPPNMPKFTGPPPVPFSALPLESEQNAAHFSLGSAPPIELAVPVRAPQITARAPRAVRTASEPRVRPRASRSVFRSLVAWCAVVFALALLVYVANAVFRRPDPRKHRKLLVGATSAGVSTP